MKSGWCTSPPGARPQHAACRSLTCGCECHDETKEKAA